MQPRGFLSVGIRLLMATLMMLGGYAVIGFPGSTIHQVFTAFGTVVSTYVGMAIYYDWRRSSHNNSGEEEKIELGVLPSRVIMALMTAAMILGLFTLTGFDKPIRIQLFIAVEVAIISQIAMAFYYSRRGSGHN